MNARELSTLIHVSEATVSRIASGDRRPSVETMMWIKDALGWSMDDQARSLAAGAYPSEFRTKMEGRGIRAARASLSA